MRDFVSMPFNSYWSFIITCQVLESVVKNCGQTVHDEVASKQTMEELKDLLKVTVALFTPTPFSFRCALPTPFNSQFPIYRNPLTHSLSRVQFLLQCQPYICIRFYLFYSRQCLSIVRTVVEVAFIQG